MQGIVLGGTEIGPATMINFYALHIAVTPLAMIALFPVSIRDGVVFVDTGRPVRRQAFEPDQVVRA